MGGGSLFPPASLGIKIDDFVEQHKTVLLADQAKWIRRIELSSATDVVPVPVTKLTLL